MPAQIFQREQNAFGFNEGPALIRFDFEFARLIDPHPAVVAIERRRARVNETARRGAAHSDPADHMGQLQIGLIIFIRDVGGDSHQNDIVILNQRRKLAFVVAFEDDAFLRNAGEALQPLPDAVVAVT